MRKRAVEQQRRATEDGVELTTVVEWNMFSREEESHVEKKKGGGSCVFVSREYVRAVLCVSGAIQLDISDGKADENFKISFVEQSSPFICKPDAAISPPTSSSNPNAAPHPNGHHSHPRRTWTAPSTREDNEAVLRGSSLLLSLSPAREVSAAAKKRKKDPRRRVCRPPRRSSHICRPATRVVTAVAAVKLRLKPPTVLLQVTLVKQCML
ncbi:hypothetical protein PIB30_014896 [Stylosanthes scabra]|uniref:Uncharacterized protein n=1 Tax=Stylosanthes scabra TaxID=79078 RepID=A0ABU6U9S8_9FABA|nr:hypothetical protein [Stylosanthes scabra]